MTPGSAEVILLFLLPLGEGWGEGRSSYTRYHRLPCNQQLLIPAVHPRWLELVDQTLFLDHGLSERLEVFRLVVVGAAHGEDAVGHVRALMNHHVRLDPEPLTRVVGRE